MKISDAIQQSDTTLFAFELLPPMKGDTIQTIYNAIDPLMDFNPAYINVTYHREEIIYKKRENGLLEKNVIRKRPGTVGISAAIKYKYKVEIVPHIICGGFSKEDTENALIDMHFLDIHNLLAIRGDTLKHEKFFSPEPDGHAHSIDLVQQIVDMNKGIYLTEDIENKNPTNFDIGVAGYPEKHSEAPNMQADLLHLKRKIEAGASYIVTQMFFDNQKYFDFVDACRNAGIMVPIIPGLKPITTRGQLLTLPQTFHIDIPYELACEIEKCADNKSAAQVGIEWCTLQSKELKSRGVPVLHYYTMGKSNNIRSIAEKVF
ncbi:MAG: methylenetetrahydrofolate reductase [Bacteroidota bacterium]